MSPRLQLALSLAEQACQKIRIAFAEATHAVNYKSPGDFATATDQQIEFAMETELTHQFPGDDMLGEEGGARRLGQAAATGYQWIVDPLDGTFNFIHGFPYIATSIAVAFEGGVCAGVVANPLTDEYFFAEYGSGAWIRVGQAAPSPIRVSNCVALDQALVASVLPSAKQSSFETVLAAWTEVARHCASIRRTGAAALDLAHVAAGRADGFFVMSLGAWDAAAASILIREAGGHICDFNGGDSFLHTNEVIAGTPAVTEALVRVLSHHSRAKPR